MSFRDDANDLHWGACRVNCPQPRLCPDDSCELHADHSCNCDEIAAAAGERLTEASAEHLSDIGGAPV